MLIVLLILLIGLYAMISAMETALFSLSPFTIRSWRQSSQMKERLAAHLLDHSRDLLVTLISLVLLSSLLIQNTVSALFGHSSSWVIKVILPLGLILIFGEILPKSIALCNNISLAKRAAPLLSRITRWGRPVRQSLIRLTNVISRILFFSLKKEQPLSQEELEWVLDRSQEKGVLFPEERSLVSGFLYLKNAKVLEMMRPREEILFYRLEEPLSKLLHLFIDQECSRVPVVEENLDQVKGIVSLQDFLFHRDNIKSSEDLNTILRKPMFAPESTRGAALLRQLREKGEDLALVVDEYGSIVGLIAQEDLIEKVTGEISDRRDSKELYTRTSDGAIIANGKMELADLESLFHLSIKREGSAVTIGGWLTEQFGDIPQIGTKYETESLLFQILSADLKRVLSVYIRSKGKKRRK